MDLIIERGDITAAGTDAIVNAANSSLLGGRGVDGAIHRAGGPAILLACRDIRATRYPAGLPPGEAVATTAGRLAARWVIHTVGPIYRADRDQAAVLRRCYIASLTVADELGASSIAFPLISAGAYRWPKDDAIRQALQAIRSASTAVGQARLVLYDDQTLALAQAIESE